MKLFKSLVITLFVVLLSSCGQDYEFNGLYVNDDFTASDTAVKFCTVVKGNVGMSWLFKQARRNPAVTINKDNVKHISINDLQEIVLKHQIKGEIKLTIGTDVASWKKLKYKPFEHPCVDSDEVINFIHHISNPYIKKTKQDLTNLSINKSVLEKLENIMKKYKDVPVYGILWESVSGRKVDVGWVFEIEK